MRETSSNSAQPQKKDAPMLNYHGPLIGCSAKAEELREEVQKAARTNLTVMIWGERGTGKDLVAGEIHLKSNRTGTFVRVNCAGLPEELVETELFGCEKGAYTGAESRKGRFEQADRGTIFLDEVGELSPKAQPKLLHVTETLAVDRVGGQRSIPVDFRLIVATNRNLQEMVRQGKFREDLYDRLNMDSIRVPPLRERMDDIPLLADYFRDRYANEAKRPVTNVSQQVLDLFQQYLWPGNIRELQNIIRRAVYKGLTGVIRVEDLPFDFAQRMAAPPVKLGNHRERMDDFERQLIVGTLTYCQDDRAKAASMLGLSLSQLYRLIKKHKLDDEPPDNGPRGSDWVQ
jgi:transcriptional regulator with PAS, ATPase and Fis domain